MLQRFRPSPFSAYLLIVAAWFFGFGLQTTLFPGVINFTLGESPQRLGFAQGALTAPMLFLLPLAGVFAERAERRTILVGFYTLAAAGAVLLGTLLLADLLSYGLLIGFALLIGVCGAFVMPARDSAINPVVRLTNAGGRVLALQKAVVFASIVQFGAQIAGMGAGWLAQYFGPAALFVVQGAGIALGAAAALALPRLAAKRAAPAAHPLADLMEGVRAVAASPVLAPMTAIMVAVGLFVVGAGFFVVIPILVRDVHGGGYDVLASLMVMFWVGALVANLVLSRLRHIERPGRALILAQLVTAFAMAGLAAPIPLTALYGLVFAWGLGGGVAMTLSRAVVQEHAPPALLARVLSVYQLGLFGGMPLGALLMGFIVAALGPRTAVLIPMAGLTIALVWIALATPILSVRRRDPGAPALHQASGPHHAP